MWQTTQKHSIRAAVHRIRQSHWALRYQIAECHMILSYPPQGTTSLHYMYMENQVTEVISSVRPAGFLHTHPMYYLVSSSTGTVQLTWKPKTCSSDTDLVGWTVPLPLVISVSHNLVLHDQSCPPPYQYWTRINSKSIYPAILVLVINCKLIVSNQEHIRTGD